MSPFTKNLTATKMFAKPEAVERHAAWRFTMRNHG